MILNCLNELEVHGGRGVEMKTRRRLMVNWSIQGPLILRLLTHLVTQWAAMATLIMICWIYQGKAVTPDAGPTSNFWYRFLPLAASAVALLPYTILDLLRISHRIAGPLYRFEMIMKEFEESGTLPPADIRENDLLRDYCARFNTFVDAVHQRYPDSCPEANASESQPESSERDPSSHRSSKAAESPELVSV